MGLVETAAGPIHYERGQGQQGRAWDCSLVLAKYIERRPEVKALFFFCLVYRCIVGAKSMERFDFHLETKRSVLVFPPASRRGTVMCRSLQQWSMQ